MKVKQALIPEGTYKQGTLVDLDDPKITRVIGPCNGLDDPAKVTYSWEFYAEHKGKQVPCAIWDYRDSWVIGRWSYYGPRAVFVELFGEDHVRD